MHAKYWSEELREKEVTEKSMRIREDNIKICINK
jgi:hypothetical protein